MVDSMLTMELSVHDRIIFDDLYSGIGIKSDHVTKEMTDSRTTDRYDRAKRNGFLQVDAKLLTPSRYSCSGADEAHL